MEITLINALEITVTLLIMIDPPGVIAPYLSLTGSLDQTEKQKVLSQAFVFSTIVLISSVFIGKAILDLLGISIYALQIAGGIIFFKFGYDVMTGKLEELEENDAPGIVPLGFPVIAGPGSITAVVLLASEITNKQGYITPDLLVIIASIAVALSITYLTLRYADPITKKIGNNTTTAIVKVVGLLIISIGIQLVLGGLQSWIVHLRGEIV